MTESSSILYLSGCSCCPSGSLTGCVQLEGGPGTTGWVNHVRTGRHWEPSPCSSFPSPHDGSRGQEAAGPSGCPSSYWHCGLLSSYTGEKVRGKADVKNTLQGWVNHGRHTVILVMLLGDPRNPSRALTHLSQSPARVLFCQPVRTCHTYNRIRPIFWQ